MELIEVTREDRRLEEESTELVNSTQVYTVTFWIVSGASGAERGECAKQRKERSAYRNETRCDDACTWNRLNGAKTYLCMLLQSI